MTDEIQKSFEPDEIVEKTVNANGQIYLGRDLDGETVLVAYKVVDE